MSPPTHALIGLVLANGGWAAWRLAGRRTESPPLPGWGWLTLALILGSVAPDLDAVSRPLGTYFSTDVWLGHRGITHSLVGVTGLAVLIAAGLSLVRWLVAPGRRGRTGLSFLILLAAAWLGGLAHLAADLPNPPGPWGGIPVAYPLSSGSAPLRWGGWSLIGWFDLESIYRLLLAGAALTGLALFTWLTRRWPRLSRLLAGGGLALALAALIWLGAYVASGPYAGPGQETARQERILAAKPVWFQELSRLGGRAAHAFFAR